MAGTAAVVLAREALEAKYSAGHRNMGESGSQALSDGNRFWKDELLHKLHQLTSTAQTHPVDEKTPY